MSFSSLPIIWKDDTLYLLDQRKLPLAEDYIEIKSLEDSKIAIYEMVVRGAPCIGFTAIFGLALWIRSNRNFSLSNFKNACEDLISARPTAVNLKFEVNKVQKLVMSWHDKKLEVDEIYQRVVHLGQKELEQSHFKNTQMAQFALEELNKLYGNKKLKLMTHCNTGYLACGSLGTALGVVSYAHSQSRIDHVFVDETRPYLQGSRLTAFELGKENIPHSIVVEGAASYLMKHYKIDAIFVGADRIAKNGDTANKIGTSTLAITAAFYNVPFYVVAPVSSFDLNISSGNEIEIEMRSPKEITEFYGHKISPITSQALNPSFDVTDHKLIKGIICERGIINPQIEGELERILKRSHE
jgi:methylthioribose-1-phosphate isomerase